MTAPSHVLPLQQRYVDLCAARTRRHRLTAADGPRDGDAAAVVVRPTRSLLTLLARLSPDDAGEGGAVVDLRGHYLGDEGAACFLDALAGVAAPPSADAGAGVERRPEAAAAAVVPLAELRMPGTGLGNEAVAALCRLLASPPGRTLHTVDLSDNPFLAVTAGKRLVERMPTWSGLRRLTLGGTNVPPAYAARIADGLAAVAP